MAWLEVAAVGGAAAFAGLLLPDGDATEHAGRARRPLPSADEAAGECAGEPVVLDLAPHTATEADALKASPRR